MFNRTLVSSFVAGVVVSLACNYLLISEPKSPPVEEINTLQNAYNAVRQKLDFLERQLSSEISSRLQLESAVAQFYSNEVIVDEPALTSTGHSLPSTPSEPGGQQTTTVAMDQQLLSKGFSNAEVDAILMSEQQVHENNLVQSWEYRRQAYLEHPEHFDLTMVNPLRARIGDGLYEKYLAAQGRRTAVSVSGVMAQSAADSAGILSGDKITHYDGQRVFHLNELLTLSAQQDRGDYTEIEVLRDNQKIYLTIATGPLGVTMPGGIN
jgi:hypothetical protein